jgi:hypothetical protein
LAFGTTNSIPAMPFVLVKANCRSRMMQLHQHHFFYLLKAVVYCFFSMCASCEY